jgi:hypothetical protein
MSKEGKRESSLEPGTAPRQTAMPALTEPSSDRQGANLALIYSLVALALAAAIGVALLIVFPFYHRP